MSTSQSPTLGCSMGAQVLTSTSDLRWYAVYTCANHEKQVARQLDLRAIECFLPLYERISRWKDRRMKIRLPLFSGYVFVRMVLEEKLRVLQIPGVVRLVGFNGTPTPLGDEEMETMRNGLTGGVHAEPCPYFSIGSHVRIKSGPLQGLKGVLLKKKNSCHLIISLDLIQRSIAVQVDSADTDTA